jgi:hypothetical protein
MPTPDAPLNTYYRYRRLGKEIEKVTGKHTIENIKQTNRCVSVTLPPDPGFKPSRTLWHAIYDCTDLTLEADFYLGEGAAPDAEPRRSGYLSFRLEKQ